MEHIKNIVQVCRESSLNSEYLWCQIDDFASVEESWKAWGCQKMTRLNRIWWGGLWFGIGLALNLWTLHLLRDHMFIRSTNRACFRERMSSSKWFLNILLGFLLGKAVGKTNYSTGYINRMMSSVSTFAFTFLIREKFSFLFKLKDQILWYIYCANN